MGGKRLRKKSKRRHRWSRKLKLGQSPQKGKCADGKEETAPRGALITPAGVLPGGPAAVFHTPEF